ncbi:NAD(P)H-dependent oxidoreductase [Streptomyces canus]|uniref:NAD(P)H-dependent oxidoreductase n=1 Tax=Streptomyces canus TaxID=58343 RepID=UPI0027893226|nr:NAD(P)H-dependent oxidoreductase [Streptomyces canus]MDQ0766597.1 putative NADPH-quinone reductase [Streptomyces canus]
MATAAQALRGADSQVDVLGLYNDAWAPVLAREEFAPVDGPFKPQAEQMRAVQDGTLDEAVKVHLERLLAADLLVLSYPLWWFSLPAILKSWIDRVFVMGALFGGDHGFFGDAPLAGKRAMLLVTTGGSGEAFRPDGAFGAVDDFLGSRTRVHLRAGPPDQVHRRYRPRSASERGRRHRTAEVVTPRRTGAVALPRSRSAASDGEPGSAV